MIYYLASGVSSSELDEFEQALRQHHDMDSFNNAWKYIKHHTSFQKHSNIGEASDTPPSSGSGAGISKIKGLAGNWAGSFAGHAQGWLSQAAESVKNFLPENKKLHIARITDAICELK